MSCTEIRGLLAARAVVTLEADENEKVAEHLRRCPACAHAASEVAVALDAACDGPYEAPRDAWRGIEARIEDHRASRRSEPRVVLSCTFCHAALERGKAVYCAACLAPHHGDCFEGHGRCSAPNCGETRVVTPRAARASRPALALVAAVVVTASTIAALAPRERPAPEKRPDREALAMTALEALERSLAAEPDAARRHALAAGFVRAWPDTVASSRVRFPLPIRTDPAGLGVRVNGVPFAPDSDGRVLAEYAGSARRVVVSLVEGEATLASVTLEDPLSWPGEVVLKGPIARRGRLESDAPIEARFAWHERTRSWVAVARDASVWVVDAESLSGRRWPGIVAVAGTDDGHVGEFGDAFSEAAISGDLAYVGGAGGVAVVDLVRRAATTRDFRAPGSVLGRPIVHAAANRLVFATTAGSVLGFELGGDRREVWRVEGLGAIKTSPVLQDDAAWFVSEDERVHVFDVRTGKTLLAVRVGAPQGELRAARDGVAVAVPGGVAFVDAAGSVRRVPLAAPCAWVPREDALAFTFVVDERGIFWGTADVAGRMHGSGTLRAGPFARLETARELHDLSEGRVLVLGEDWALTIDTARGAFGTYARVPAESIVVVDGAIVARSSGVAQFLRRP